jgi:hypothetical protein
MADSGRIRSPTVRLYHFTSLRHLRGIANHGITVGDVQTDIDGLKGCVGVWLTDRATPENLGLGGAKSKRTIRITVDLPASPLLHKWADWAPGNVTQRTIDILHNSAPTSESWWIYFGIIRPKSFVVCEDLATDASIDMGAIPPRDDDLPGVPAWMREKWYKRVLWFRIFG